MEVLSRIILSLLPAGYILVRPAQADLPEQFFDPVDGRFDASTYLPENAFGFLPVPVIITEPAVEGGLGMTGLFFHESDEDAAVRQEAMLSSGNAAHLLPPSASAIFQTLKFQVGDSPVFIGATQRYVDAELSLNNSNSDAGGDLGSAASRVSKGLGFRYEIARRYGFHMGIDLARGPEDTVLYIQAGSAW